MLSYKLRPAAYGRTKVSAATKEGGLTRGGPLQRAMEKDMRQILKLFLQSYRAEGSNNASATAAAAKEDSSLGDAPHAALGAAFRAFGELFRDGDVAKVFQTIPSRSSHQAFSQLVYASCFSLLREASSVEEAAAVVFLLYTLKETHPMTTHLEPKGLLPTRLMSLENYKMMYRRPFNQRIRIDRECYLRIQEWQEKAIAETNKCRMGYWKMLEIVCREAERQTASQKPAQAVGGPQHQTLSHICTCGIARDFTCVFDRLKPSLDLCEYTGPASLEGLVGHADYESKCWNKRLLSQEKAKKTDGQQNTGAVRSDPPPHASVEEDITADDQAASRKSIDELLLNSNAAIDSYQSQLRAIRFPLRQGQTKKMARVRKHLAGLFRDDAAVVGSNGEQKHDVDDDSDHDDASDDTSNASAMDVDQNARREDDIATTTHDRHAGASDRSTPNEASANLEQGAKITGQVTAQAAQTSTEMQSAVLKVTCDGDKTTGVNFKLPKRINPAVLSMLKVSVLPHVQRQMHQRRQKQWAEQERRELQEQIADKQRSKEAKQKKKKEQQAKKKKVVKVIHRGKDSSDAMQGNSGGDATATKSAGGRKRNTNAVDNDDLSHATGDGQRALRRLLMAHLADAEEPKQNSANVQRRKRRGSQRRSPTDAIAQKAARRKGNVSIESEEVDGSDENSRRTDHDTMAAENESRATGDGQQALRRLLMSTRTTKAKASNDNQELTARRRARPKANKKSVFPLLIAHHRQDDGSSASDLSSASSLGDDHGSADVGDDEDILLREIEENDSDEDDVFTGLGMDRGEQDSDDDLNEVNDVVDDSVSVASTAAGDYALKLLLAEASSQHRRSVRKRRDDARGERPTRAKRSRVARPQQSTTEDYIGSKQRDDAESIGTKSTAVGKNAIASLLQQAAQRPAKQPIRRKARPSRATAPAKRRNDPSADLDGADDEHSVGSKSTTVGNDALASLLRQASARQTGHPARRRTRSSRAKPPAEHKDDTNGDARSVGSRSAGAGKDALATLLSGVVEKDSQARLPARTRTGTRSQNKARSKPTESSPADAESPLPVSRRRSLRARRAVARLSPQNFDLSDGQSVGSQSTAHGKRALSALLERVQNQKLPPKRKTAKRKKADESNKGQEGISADATAGRNKRKKKQTPGTDLSATKQQPKTSDSRVIAPDVEVAESPIPGQAESSDHESVSETISTMDHDAMSTASSARGRSALMALLNASTKKRKSG